MKSFIKKILTIPIILILLSVSCPGDKDDLNETGPSQHDCLVDHGITNFTVGMNAGATVLDQHGNYLEGVSVKWVYGKIHGCTDDDAQFVEEGFTNSTGGWGSGPGYMSFDIKTDLDYLYGTLTVTKDSLELKDERAWTYDVLPGYADDIINQYREFVFVIE
jgi:hypothetical protein